MVGFSRAEIRIWPIGSLPLRAKLFCICNRGDARSRRIGGKLAGIEANRPLPTMGLVWARSGAGEEI